MGAREWWGGEGECGEGGGGGGGAGWQTETAVKEDAVVLPGKTAIQPICINECERVVCLFRLLYVPAACSSHQGQHRSAETVVR